MAKFRLRGFKPFAPPQGWHHVLSVLVPAFYAALWEFLLGAIPPWPQTLAAWGLSLCWSFWMVGCSSMNGRTFLKLWLWAVPAGLYYLAEAAFGGFSQGLVLPEDRLLWFFAGAVQGLATLFWQGNLVSRARLFLQLEGLTGGPELWERRRNFELDADFSEFNCSSLTASAGLFALVTVFLAAGPGQSLGWAGVFCAGGGLALGFWLVCLFRLYRREMEALVYGHRMGLIDKARTLGLGLILILAALGLGGAAVLAVGPFHINPFWPDILFQVPQGAPPVITDRPPPMDRGHSYSMAILALYAELFRVRRVVRFFVDLIQWGISLWPLALAGFFLVPVVAFFQSGHRPRWRLFLVFLKKIHYSFFGWLRSWKNRTSEHTPRGRKLGGSPLAEALELLKGLSAPGLPYRKDLSAVFLEVCDWALTLGSRVPDAAYRRGETCRAYLTRLGRLIPEAAVDLDQISQILDEGFFSREGIGSGDRKKLRSLVESLRSRVF